MASDSYTVNRKDTSFKSFICILLIFLALCLMINLLLVFKINKKDDDNKANYHNKLEGEPTPKPRHFTKPQPRPIPTTAATTTTAGIVDTSSFHKFSLSTTQNVIPTKSKQGTTTTAGYNNLNPVDISSTYKETTSTAENPTLIKSQQGSTTTAGYNFTVKTGSSPNNGTSTTLSLTPTKSQQNTTTTAGYNYLNAVNITSTYKVGTSTTSNPVSTKSQQSRTTTAGYNFTANTGSSQNVGTPMTQNLTSTKSQQGTTTTAGYNLNSVNISLTSTTPNPVSIISQQSTTTTAGYNFTANTTGSSSNVGATTSKTLLSTKSQQSTTTTAGYNFIANTSGSSPNVGTTITQTLLSTKSQQGTTTTAGYNSLNAVIIGSTYKKGTPTTQSSASTKSQQSTTTTAGYSFTVNTVSSQNAGTPVTQSLAPTKYQQGSTTTSGYNYLNPLNISLTVGTHTTQNPISTKSQQSTTTTIGYNLTVNTGLSQVSTSTTQNLISTTPQQISTTTAGYTYLNTSLSNRFATSVLSNPNDNICKSTECYSEAKQILSLMNHTKDACMDFYEFACGGPGLADDGSKDDYNFLMEFLENNIIDRSPGFLRTYKGYYTTCNEYEEHFNYNERMEFILQNVNATETNVTALFGETILTQTLPIFEINLDFAPDRKYIIKISRNSDGLRSKIENWSFQDTCNKKCLNKQKITTLISDPDLDVIYSSYTECSKRCLYTAFEDFLNTIDNDIPYVNIFNEMNKIKQFIRLLNDAPNSASSTKKIPVKDLNDELYFTGLDWNELISHLTGNNDPDAEIQIDDTEYFEFLIEKMEVCQFEETTMKYFLLLVQYMTFYQNTVIPKNTENREKYCIDLSRQLMPDITNYIYQTQYTREKLTQQNPMIFYNLRTHFKKELEKSNIDGIPELTDILEKIEVVPETKRDMGKFEIELDQNYGSIPISKKFQENHYELLKIYRLTILKHFKQTLENQDLFTYFINTYDEYPLAFTSIKSIAVPPRLFQVVPFNKGLMSVYTSKVSFRLAKEIMKHFQFSEILKAGVPNSLISAYKNILNHPLNAKSPAIYLNKKLYFDEDNADLVSGQERIIENAAFGLIETMKKNDILRLPLISEYSSDQIFYISAAQEYCRKKEDILDFMIKIKTGKPLPATLLVKNIANNANNFYGCPFSSNVNPRHLKVQFPRMPLALGN